ncbi:MAG: hypothetical protein LBG48_02625 [Rickettsiales bacterium]|nr:hypothetical protein [Rickettsiales bacterium]
MKSNVKAFLQNNTLKEDLETLNAIPYRFVYLFFYSFLIRRLLWSNMGNKFYLIRLSEQFQVLGLNNIH